MYYCKSAQDETLELSLTRKAIYFKELIAHNLTPYFVTFFHTKLSLHSTKQGQTEPNAQEIMQSPLQNMNVMLFDAYLFIIQLSQGLSPLGQKPRNIMPIFAHHYPLSLVSFQIIPLLAKTPPCQFNGRWMGCFEGAVRTKPDRHLDEWAQWKTNHCQKTLHE